MKKLCFVLVFAILSSGAICSPHRRVAAVTDAELAGISAEDKAEMDAKAALLQAAEDAINTRKADLAVAEREVQIAELAVSRDKTALKIAGLKFEAAQDTKNAEAMLPAKQAREEASAQVERSTAEEKYAEASRDYLEQVLEVGKAERPVAEANLELAKYEAAARAKGGPDAERLAGFKADVAHAQAELAEVQVSAAKAKAQVDAARPRGTPAQAPAAPTPGGAVPTQSPDAPPSP